MSIFFNFYSKSYRLLCLNIYFSRFEDVIPSIILEWFYSSENITKSGNTLEIPTIAA